MGSITAARSVSIDSNARAQGTTRPRREPERTTLIAFNGDNLFVRHNSLTCCHWSLVFLCNEVAAFACPFLCRHRGSCRNMASLMIIMNLVFMWLAAFSRLAVAFS